MDFIDDFTPEELRAIYEASRGNPAYCQACYHEVHEDACEACEEYGAECPTQNPTQNPTPRG